MFHPTENPCPPAPIGPALDVETLQDLVASWRVRSARVKRTALPFETDEGIWMALDGCAEQLQAVIDGAS